MKLTFISDTHGMHENLPSLPGGDVLIHAGDISEKGYTHEVKKFLKWFDTVRGYDHKIFIAGNHDFLFEQQERLAKEIVDEFDSVTYLFDESVEVYTPDYESKVKIYGSPWQPRFYNWAFNVDRDSDELENIWKRMPDDVDILVTHGPPKKILDLNSHDNYHCGCERLEKVIWKKDPKLHVFGHIHEGYGWMSKMKTHFFNASSVDKSYNMVNEPFNIEWDYETNKITFL